MSRSSTLPLILLSTLVTALALPPVAGAEKTEGGKIKKCKDAEGRWHYGDRAAEECAKSKIVEISEQGTQRRVIAAPPTAAELADRERRKEELERAAQQKADQERQDQLLLSTYANEDDIVYIRDRKLAQIDSQIKATEQTLAPMRAALERMEKQAEKDKSPQLAQQIEKTKDQITRHEGVIAEKQKEQEQLRTKYASDLERYRELRGKAAAEASSTKKP